jgi:hypothetical protein
LVIGSHSSVIPLKRDFLSTIGGTCAFEAKIMRFSWVWFWLSRYRKRGKKNFKFAVLGAQVAARLIENWPQKGTKNIRLRPDSIGTTDGQAKRNWTRIYFVWRDVYIGIRQRRINFLDADCTEKYSHKFCFDGDCGCGYCVIGR